MDELETIAALAIVIAAALLFAAMAWASAHQS
jgi:HAMP domain-containing protein